MQTIRHKNFGQGNIIAKEEKNNHIYITVHFDSISKDMCFVIPESVEAGFIVPEGNFKDETDAFIEARNELERKNRETKVLAPASAVCKHSKSVSSASRNSLSNIDSNVRDNYESYLLREGYAETTPSGAPSTVAHYIKSIELVLDEEHLTWSTLKFQIDRIIALYSDGGAKEDIGNKQHKTVINALHRFKDFC